MIVISPPTANSWNTLTNKPAILSDNQISWDEIQNKPTIEAIAEQDFTPVLTDSNNFIYALSSSIGKYKKVGNVYCFFAALVATLPTNGIGLKATGNFTFYCSGSLFIQ